MKGEYRMNVITITAAALVGMSLAVISGCVGVMNSQAGLQSEKAVSVPVEKKLSVPEQVIPTVKISQIAVPAPVMDSTVKEYAGSSVVNAFAGTPEMVRKRFVDNNNGTVSDSATGLVWLKDASCLGAQPWSQALSVARGLANGACGLKDGSSPGQWRLPTMLELRGIFETSPPALIISQNIFSNVNEIGKYWSSNTFAGDVSVAWYVYAFIGSEDHDGRENNFLVWPVRSK